MNVWTSTFFCKIKQFVVTTLENLNKLLKFRQQNIFYHAFNSHKIELETIHNISFDVGITMKVCPTKVVLLNRQVVKTLFVIAVWDTYLEAIIKQHNYGFWLYVKNNGIHMLYSEEKTNNCFM